MKMFAMAMAVGCLAVSAVGGEPYGLMVERQENPCGVDAAAPRFSWKMLEKDAKNVTQSAYRVLVASSQERLARDEEAACLVAPLLVEGAHVGWRWRRERMERARHVGDGHYASRWLEGEVDRSRA